jgi:RNA polymerase sigma-70 factor (ECF subfamily)
MASDAEADLLIRCRKGEPAAWDELFDRHYASAARFVFQLDYGLHPEDVEEICQEVFLSVVKHLRSFSGNSQFQTWLFRIAVNKTRDFIERQRAAKRGGGQTVLSLQAEDCETGLSLDVPSSAPTPDSALLTRERAVLVARALQQLGDPCREIIELRYFGELAYEEIACALQMNVKTVSSRLSKCLDQLEVIGRKTFSEGEKAKFPSNL